MNSIAVRRAKAETKIRIVIVVLVVVSMQNTAGAKQGIFFSKKKYVPKPIPVFENSRDQLPSPVFDENPDYVRCYWKAWELAFKNFHEPAKDSGFVSQFIDAAFNQNIFLWDTCFLTMFCNYAHPYVPGICSLDNFYIKQHETGEICREINRTTGKDFEPWINAENEPLFSRWGYAWDKGTKKTNVIYKGRKTPTPNPKLTLDCLNHPIFTWAELQSYRITGDKDRLELVWEPLVRYYAALEKYLRQGNGLYITDSASMDNATRNKFLESGGMGIDISCEMVLFARNLAEMATFLEKPAEARRYNRQAEELSALINRYMWDQNRSFYFDLTLEGKKAPVRSIAAFWALLAKVASKSQAEALVSELENEKTFNTIHRVPTLAADEPGFDPTGGYWNGAVWAPTNRMIVEGLENYNCGQLARQIALNHLHNIIVIFNKTGTLWENYAPKSIAPGKPSKGDFVGWTGIGPIAFFIEYAIGIQADAVANKITWDIHSPKRVGIEKFWFGGKTVSLICEQADLSGIRLVTVKSDGDFHLTVKSSSKIKTVLVPSDQKIQLRI